MPKLPGVPAGRPAAPVSGYVPNNDVASSIGRVATATATAAASEPLGIIAKGGAEIGVLLARAEAKTQQREDALADIHGRRSYLDATTTRMREYEEAGDTSLGAYTQLQADLDNVRKSTVKSYPGSANGRALFEGDISTLDAQFRQNAYITRQRGIKLEVNNDYKQTAERFQGQVYSSPSALPQALTDLDNYHNRLAPTLGVEGSAMRDAARARLAYSTADGLVAKGDYDTAGALIAKLPELGIILPPEQIATLDKRIRAGAQDQLAGVSEGQRKVQAAETILGRPVTPEERARIAGLEPPKPDEPRAQQRVTQYSPDGAEQWEAPYDPYAGTVGPELPGTRRPRAQSLEETLGRILAPGSGGGTAVPGKGTGSPAPAPSKPSGGGNWWNR